MNYVNPYFKLKHTGILDALYKERDELSAQQHDISQKLHVCNAVLENIKITCNHTNEDGTTSYEEYKTLKKCFICKKQELK